MGLKFKVYSDGASRGNPGPSAAAFMIVSEDSKIIRRHSEYLGLRTNNQAEYEALISALQFASQLRSKEITCYMDSELIVKHLSGEYRVRNSDLRVLWQKIQDLKESFRKISFNYIPRTNSYIQEVDRLANEALEKATSTGK